MPAETSILIQRISLIIIRREEQRFIFLKISEKDVAYVITPYFILVLIDIGPDKERAKSVSINNCPP